MVAPTGPASAERYDPMAGLAVHPEWGSVTGHSGVLRRGCKKYTYSYAINPPEGDWALEIFLSGPRFEYLGGGGFLEGGGPEQGTGAYKMGRNTTKRGRFTSEAKLSVAEPGGEVTEQGQLPPDHFRLRRPPRR